MKTPRGKSQTTNTATIFAIVSLLLPSIALAQVQITEVMYDAPGSDSGREWIEIINTGSENVDVGKYKFLENDTNHGLTLVSGSAILPPNSTAVIASDASKFVTDYPNFSGTLFDSAFALSNTGESIALKNASSSVIGLVSYTASDEASGTGGSLQRKGNTFVVALASPGVYPGEFVAVPKASAKEKAASRTKNIASKNIVKKGSATSLPAPQNFDTEENAAAVSLLPTLSPLALSLLGLLAVILLGVSACFFLLVKGKETSGVVEEFTIE